MKRRIRQLESQLLAATSSTEDCPHGLNKKARVLASGGSNVGQRCGLSHRRAEVVRIIGLTIYGDKPKKTELGG